MNKNANPLDYIIRCCEQGLIPESFDINNAKDELKRLRQKIDSFSLIGWGRVNRYGDIYDLRLHGNDYVDDRTIMPLYYDKDSYDKLIREDWKNGNKKQ